MSTFPSQPDSAAPVTTSQMRALEERSERRLHVTWAIALVSVVVALVSSLPPAARAQYGVTLASLNTRLTAAENKINDLASKTQFMSVTGTTTLFTGTNVQIVSGSGATDDKGVLTGLGNLIVGCNPPNPFSSVRTGSHNLIVGDQHSYSSYGGFVAGAVNTISGPYASVSGGEFNRALGLFSSVSGGAGNVASGEFSSISGEVGNAVSANFGWSVGGDFHRP